MDVQTLLQEGLPRLAKVIDKAQRVYDRIDRVYVALCEGREGSEECRYLRNGADEVVRETNELLGLYTETNTAAKEASK
jgi:hypothetical protein